MRIEIVEMTPERAAELLKLNTHNRVVKRGNVERLKVALLRGEFAENGDAIRISRTNVLLDGQHRLIACVESGVTFRTVIVSDLDDAAQDTIDTQSRRSVADSLTLAGFPSAPALAASVRQIMGYLDGVGNGLLADTVRTKAFIEEHPDIHECVRVALHARAVVAPGPFGAVLFLGTRSGVHKSRMEDFSNHVANGEGLAAGDPRLALRNGMINARMRNGARSPKVDYIMTVTTHAWNAFVSGRTLSLVKALPNAKGKYTQPDIIGAPGFGAGEGALAVLRPVRSAGRSK